MGAWAKHQSHDTHIRLGEMCMGAYVGWGVRRELQSLMKGS